MRSQVMGLPHSIQKWCGTWCIKLTSRDGSPPEYRSADQTSLHYLLPSVPAVLMVSISGPKDPGSSTGAVPAFRFWDGFGRGAGTNATAFAPSRGRCGWMRYFIVSRDTWPWRGSLVRLLIKLDSAITAARQHGCASVGHLSAIQNVSD